MAGTGRDRYYYFYLKGIMTHLIRRIAVAAAATAVAGLVLAGCSSSDDAEATTAAPVTTAAQEATEAPVVETETAEEPADASSSGALQAYVDAVRPQLEGMTDPTYESTEIHAVGEDTLEYVYTFAEPQDVALMAEGFESMSGMLEAGADMVIPEMERNGVVNAKVTYTYLNPDGSLIWSRTYAGE